jgi:WD40 repeat protein
MEASSDGRLISSFMCWFACPPLGVPVHLMVANTSGSLTRHQRPSLDAHSRATPRKMRSIHVRASYEEYTCTCKHDAGPRKTRYEANLDCPVSGHQADVTSVCFSPDGNKLVSGSNNKVVMIWDASPGCAMDAPVMDIVSYQSSLSLSLSLSLSFSLSLSLSLYLSISLSLSLQTTKFSHGACQGLGFRV